VRRRCGFETGFGRAARHRSNILGTDQRITNTGGGNTSAKILERDPLTGGKVEVLWVKGSGGDLRTSKRENFASLYQQKLIEMQKLYASELFPSGELPRLLEKTMSASKRDEILGRIREALRVPAPRRHGGAIPDDSQEIQIVQTPRAWLPAVPPDAAQQLDLFREKCIQLRTDFQPVAGTEEAATVLATLRDRHGWTVVGSHHHPLVDPLVQTLGLETVYMEQHPEAKSLERCSVGITACDALLAQTGSILLTTRSAGGRALSVLPPHHVVIARIDQLLPDLPAAFELLYAKYGDNYPSFVTFITGPSRTGDIERILVLGAHGPRNLTILLIGCGDPELKS
jgi:L-lactate dehydrogenase complex protein LldG